MKKIGIIGMGGRTGTMFFQELKDFGKIVGIGKPEDISLIQSGKVFIERNNHLEKIKGTLISSEEFPKEEEFDFLFLTVKNPVFEAVRYYYQRIKEKSTKIPILFLSQNGIEAGKDALIALKEIFGEKEIPVFRISLFNPIEKKSTKDQIIISYFLPIKISISQISGEKEAKKTVFNFFRKTNFKIFWVSRKEAKNMEFSKLFLNLIGMASASYGFSISDGFFKKEIFEEEIEMMKEYIRVVKKSGGKFLNFPGYPIKIFSLIFSLPNFVLFPFRKIFAKLIESTRKGKPKDFGEIDYYNGAVIRLGETLKVPTPINKKIFQKIKNGQNIH